MTNDPTDEWIRQLMKLYDEESKMTEKQLRILQAAIDIFAEKGYAAASTSEIAQRAGVAEGTIFRHYKTKKELLLSIVSPMMAKLVAPYVLRDFTKVLEAEYQGFDEFLRAVLLNRIAFARAHLPTIKIMVQEIPFQPELREQFKTIVAQQVYNRLEKAIRHFQERGQIVPLPIPTVLRLIASVIIGYLASRFLVFSDQEWDDDWETEQCISFILHGLSVRPGGEAR